MDAVVEETAETKSVKVTHKVAKPLEKVWAALMQPNGQEPLLGKGGQLGSKGVDWASTDGPHGVTRSFHPMEQIRFSWHEAEGAPRSLVDLQMKPVDGGTELHLTHELIEDGYAPESLTERWETALRKLDDQA
ncbi:SRPBCC domain-containing protein [Tessaracoccus sp. MC1865]|uniref:SRPBCC family protein n=1 Tax=unclassified Tessaracoccus TaxID=2635419 RepID=UPI00096ED128|nr:MULTISPECIES: SRPBCC domain-containing protein [unclassified Tessaracoccus]MBB1483200.1 SRPBCC domain-containing protein [Tessaracoccus sp. MC1865]MBB1510370.1 SRPBCC domain-containing protein [Tessaracoccus sp. MC1756]MCG6567560.1 SRPBCC domain-containing protein [Tessaracoccus sp. ZS01]OMG55924.1 hypothetical protein BJN44_07995 [Tessaracoccus sp. ZS01]QTO37382.1 SRPBCC domain-containing protein [Tessaracoccus sp. MC1865]